MFEKTVEVNKEAQKNRRETLEERGVTPSPTADERTIRVNKAGVFCECGTMYRFDPDNIRYCPDCHTEPGDIKDEQEFSVIEHQVEREDLGDGDIEEDDWSPRPDSEDNADGCPECGSTHTSSYQQQTGGADEGMTGFHNCNDCGHNWRTGYGS